MVNFHQVHFGQINYIIPYKEKLIAEYEEAVKNGEKDVLVSKFEYLNWIHKEDYINIDNFFPEFVSQMPINALVSQYYGFDRLTAIGDEEYLIEIDVDTEGINQYDIIEKENGKKIQHIEYDNHIRYAIPKDKLGSYVIDCRKNGLDSKILNYRVRYIGGELYDIPIEDLIIK